MQKIICTTINLSEFFSKLIKRKHIDVAYIFNGRQNQYRPLFRHLLKNKIKTICLEFRGPGDTNVFEFINHLPHDYNHYAFRIEQYFKKQKLTKLELTQKVHHYYRSIIKSKQIQYTEGKSIIFNKNQKLGLLPKDFNEKEENIAFIISSEFEYVALGGVYEIKIYKTQIEAIKRIAQSLLRSKKIKLWIRLHPNLHNVKWSYIQEFYNLEEKFKFINVIPSNSNISSFSLLLNCSKVITFGSRMGIEAVYAKKPAIILFRNSYEKLNTQYIPKNHLEVMKLIFSDLKPKPILGAEKYALFESHGGKKEVGFKGSFTDGFTFYKNKTKKNAYNKIIYFVGRFIDKYYFFLLRNEGIKRSFKHFIFKLFNNLNIFKE